MSASLSVVIPTKDGASRLPATLAAIAAQQVACEVEVIVVDDGSTDGSAELARGWALPRGRPRVLSHDRARGRAAACNTGVQSAQGEVIVLLDDDMTLLPGALEAHRLFHCRHPGAAARARVTLESPREDSAFARFSSREERQQEQMLLDRHEDLPFSLCLTGHFSIPRQVLLLAGGFDATIERYGFEDIDLGYRLWQRGVRLHYEPAATSVHRSYATDLSRYLERHLEAGIVAGQLAERYPSGPFRDYLRVDPPKALGVGKDPAGLVALRVANRLLLRRPVRRALGSRVGFAALLGLLRAGEALRLDRAVHFGYHLARDVRYFQGYFGERS